MTIKDALDLGFKCGKDGEWRKPIIQESGLFYRYTWQHYFKKICHRCENTFLASHKSGEYCNARCASKGRPSAMKGVSFLRHGSYGKKRTASNGYIEIYMPGHPLADTKGRVLEHRLIIFNQIKRPLTFNDVVHHINGKRSDNRRENLILLTRADHNSHHKPEEIKNRKRDVKGRLI